MPIQGNGYATASGGIGSLPCAFRSPEVDIVSQTNPNANGSCAVPLSRGYPGEPPTGLTVPNATLSPRAAQWNLSAAGVPPIVHVSVYARPPDQGPFGPQNGYAWVQGNLQYSLEAVEAVEARASAPAAAAAGTTTELRFEAGGGQVNSFSWVMGAANIQNGSRFFVENAGLPELDAPGEYFHDVDARGAGAGCLYLILPVGVGATRCPPSCFSSYCCCCCCFCCCCRHLRAPSHAP